MTFHRAPSSPLRHIAAIIGGLGWAACSGNGESGASASALVAYPHFDGSSAYELVERQLGFGPRVPGTPGHQAMVEWVEGYLTERADSLIVQRFRHVSTAGDTLELVNFLARFRPSASPSLLLLSHWDTRPTADNDADSEASRLPVPGANDGGSGTAILLELADMLRESPPPRPVALLLVDGEDYGDFGVGQDVFLGSRYFAANLPDGLEVEYGVLLDMVGDRDLEIFVEGNSNRLAPEVVDRVWNVAHRLGFADVFVRSVRHTIKDDHIPLNDVGIRTIDVIDFDYAYWHTLDDTLDKVSPSSLGVVGEVMTRLIYRSE